MIVKMIVDAKDCAAYDMLVDAESIKIAKIDEGMYSVVVTLPSGAVYSSNAADVNTIGDLPMGDKPIDQWYSKLTFRKVNNPERPVTKTTFFE